MKKQREAKTGERGITLIALLVMIIILIILTAVVIRTITGDEPIIGITAETAEDYKVESYREEIEHTVHSEIITKSAIGEVATTEDVSNALNDEEWVKTAYVNEDVTPEVGDITVHVVEGYIFQVYYNNRYGKIEVDYIGNVDPSDLTLTARYEKNVASIFATAEDKKNGVAKMELIYKGEIVGEVKQNPTGEQKWDVSKIGTGWYKVKATSNIGAIRYKWVEVINISDRLTKPDITVETESQKNEKDWYNGKDENDVPKEVWIKISTKSPSATQIIYTLSGATIQEETIVALSEADANGEKSIKIKLENCGPTIVVAATGDGEGTTEKYRSETNTKTVKYDNIPPRITTSTETQVQGTKGTGDWYKSPEVKIIVEAEDTPAGILDGYIYTITGTGENATTQEIHQRSKDEEGNYKPITIDKDGEYEVEIQAIDEAENRSTTRTLTIKKDSTPPTVEKPQIGEITETSIQVSVTHNDETSGVAYFEYYVNGNKHKTDTSAITTLENLTPKQSYNISVIAYDNAGNPSKPSATTTASTKGELLPPNVEITGDQRNGYYIGTVTITVTDKSEESKTRVTRMKVSGGPTEQTINGTSGSFTIETDGTYNLTAWSEDTQGNRSDNTTKQAFTRDATPPNAPTISPTSTAWQSGNVTVTMTPGSDSTSGVYGIRYKIEGAKTVAQNDVATTTNKTETINVNGTSTVTAYTIDKAGHISSARTQTINRDATAPNPTLGTATPNSNGTIKVTATANESGGSGVKSYEFQYKNSSSGSWISKSGTISSTASTYTYTYTGMGDGVTRYIRVIVKDGAGNVGRSAADNASGTTVVIPSANTKPVMQTVTYSSKTTSSITVTARATDAQNDALTYTIYVSENGSSWTSKGSSSSVSAGSTVTLTASGLSEYTNYYIKVRATETYSRTPL